MPFTEIGAKPTAVERFTPSAKKQIKDEIDLPLRPDFGTEGRPIALRGKLWYNVVKILLLSTHNESYFDQLYSNTGDMYADGMPIMAYLDLRSYQGFDTEVCLSHIFCHSNM